MYREEIESLFDLGTVVQSGDAPVHSPGKIRKRIVSVSQPILKDSSISFKKDKFIKYEEVSDQELVPPKLNIFKACGAGEQRSGHSPCMPSLRLEMRDREYDEPVRSRDKDWVLESHRPIINGKGRDIVEPKFDIPLGKYKQTEKVSKQFWAKEYQTMLRECLLLRQAAIISDTNCIVEVYGVGFTGRLFTDGATSPKLLVIEVYSIWNSQKYMLVLTVMELRLLLVNHPDLLKPGRRSDLLHFLVGALYFEYTVTIPPRENPNAPKSVADSTDGESLDPSVASQGTGRRARRGRKSQLPPQHTPHVHVTKEERAAFRHNLQRELAHAHAHHHGLTDAQLEAIIPVNTHHDPTSHIEVHIDHSVPHLQIHFEPEPGTLSHGTKTSAHAHHSHAASAHSGGGPHDVPQPHLSHRESSQAATPVRVHTPVVTSRSHTGQDPASASQTIGQSEDQEVNPDADAVQQNNDDALAEAIMEAVDGVTAENDAHFMSKPTVLKEEGEGDVSEQFPETKRAATPVRTHSPAAAPPVDPFTAVQVQTVVHLDPPVMPKGYPTTIEQMIRIPPVKPEGSLDPAPIVTQQLHIGTYRRINGPVLRKQQAIERRIAQEREEARLRALWLATPKRRRNLKGIRLFRRCNYMVLLTGYFDPLRPNTITFKGTVASEATRMSMYLGLGRIRDILKLDTPPQSWSSDELKEYVSKVMRFAGIVKTDSGAGYAINILRSTGAETALRHAHTVEEFLATLRARQRRTGSAQMHNPDSLSAYYVGYLEDSSSSGHTRHSILLDTSLDESTRPYTASTAENNSSRPFTADTYSTEGVPVTTPLISLDELLRCTDPPQSYGGVGNGPQSGWTSLGAAESSRRVGAALSCVLRPYREIGRHRRMSSRAVRVQHVYCIYALYANTTKMKRHRSKTIPAWPAPRVPTTADAVRSLADDQSLAAAESSDDDDYLKARASDSDADDSEEEDVLASLSKGGKKKKGGKGHGQDDLKDGEEDADSNLVDRQNDSYAAMAEGLVLELTIYVPHASQFQELPIPTGNYRITFTMDELDPMFPMPADKARVARAMRAVYRCFFDTATGVEVRQAEADWDWLGASIVKRARWAVRGGLPDRVVTAVSDLQQSELNIDLLQEMFSAKERQVYIQTLLYASAEPVITADTTPERELFSEGSSMKLLQPVSVKVPVLGGEMAPALPAAVGGSPHVSLTWSRVGWSKAMKIRCANGDRGESVRLQVMAFQRGAGLGAVCFDRERHEVHFAEHPDPELALSQIRGMRFLSPSERSVQLFVFLTAALVYAEVVCEDGVTRGKVTFGAADDEGAVLDSADVVEDDYAAATESLLNTATSKAQARMRRKA